MEAELVAAQLRGAGVPAIVLGLDAATGSEMRLSEGARVMVRRADLETAEQIVDDVTTGDPAAPPITDEELASLAERSADPSDPVS